MIDLHRDGGNAPAMASRGTSDISGTIAEPEISHMERVRRWWLNHVAQNVDHRAVVEKVHEESGWNGHYAFMTLMSAGIAVLGLLLSSPAVVIGAMLLSPLMGPIIGLGFALALFDLADIRRALIVLASGVGMAVIFTALIVVLSPLQTVTPEIAARTRPNLFDLLVALFSALAGAYAMIRGRHGAIVGVAIATALMPPLAVTGFGLATWNATVFGGALLLFFTNLMTIAVAAAVMARVYGFGAYLSPRQTRLQAAVMIVSMAVLAVPLALALRQIAWEAVVSRQARDVIARQFPEGAQVSDLRIDFAARPIRVTANVLTPDIAVSAADQSERAIERSSARDFDVVLRQLRVGTVGEAQAAELASARANEAQTALRHDIAAMGAQLAAVAGVSVNDVTIDADRKRAEVRARPLPDATLATYAALERRIRGGAPGWDVRLVPPVLPLPAIVANADGRPEPETLALVAWAAVRTGLPVAVTASSNELADAIGDALLLRGVTVTAVDGDGPDDRAIVRWDVGAPQ